MTNELDIFVGNTTLIDEDVYRLWLDGYSGLCGAAWGRGGARRAERRLGGRGRGGLDVAACKRAEAWRSELDSPKGRGGA